MSRETAVEIHITLDALKAPPNASIAERIRGLVGPAAAALHEAGVVVGEGTLAEAITAALADAKAARRLLSAFVPSDATLADAASRMLEIRLTVITQRDEQLAARMAAQRDQSAAEEALGAERHRADVAEGALQSANNANANLLHIVSDLRADVARLSNQLDYATELCLAGFRQ